MTILNPFPVRHCPNVTLSDPGEEMGRARNAGMCPSEERRGSSSSGGILSVSRQ